MGWHSKHDRARKGSKGRWGQTNTPELDKERKDIKGISRGDKAHIFI